ncbi:hypothetical protein DAPPUDRAFT_116777 [Daphnia pulex]|uniref:Uncharacterized protein n=1 Tax=Daphnia pulex TaxID=6669 RepID=E9HQG8_DAPPU|nr:hypothetical protein DAPPUDRAFT_116777 [Daphnia pulex]|eukprot:EFX65999.1 hypothetical protein DAPPUDRAFT_116777 [Daphnia pulex]
MDPKTAVIVFVRNTKATVTVYVVKDAVIGASVVLGMDTIIALHDESTVRDSKSRKVTIPSRCWQPVYPFHSSPKPGQPRISGNITGRYPVLSGPPDQYNIPDILNGDHTVRKRHMSSICHRHHFQHDAWGELFENNGLQINIQGVNHIMATNYGSPPVPPARTFNSRPDMSKVRSKRPCEISMHGGREKFQ